MNARERLSGKVAVVTGAGSRAPGIGIGRATSVLIAREGASVALLDNRREWAEETFRMIDEEGGNAFVVECDVTQPSSCESAVAEILSNVDGIDILVNNVGIGGPAGTAIDVDPAEWDQAMAVNVKSMMLMAKYCIPEMITRGGGSMINIASMAGIRGGHPDVAYPATKGAVVNMTRAMAAHHGADGIRVNCVAPGLVYTPLVAVQGLTPELREARRLASALKTEGTAWDVAMAVVFLASDESRWITAVTLPVDAGITAITPTPVPRPGQMNW